MLLLVFVLLMSHTAISVNVPCIHDVQLPEAQRAAAMRLGSWMCPAEYAYLYLSSLHSNLLQLLSGPRGIAAMREYGVR